MSYPTQPGGPQYGPPVQPGPATPSTGRRVVRIGWVIGIGVGCFIFGAAAGAAGGGGDDGKTASPGATVTVTATPEPAAKADGKATPTPAAKATTAKPKPKPKPAGPPKEFGDGTYKVGTDVAAGTYRTGGPSDSDFPSCYWARTKDASGEFEAIIANGNPTGPASLTIKTGEYVESSGCDTWKKVG